jgi:formylglycine-generating enzyme required for sulfatase activity
MKTQALPLFILFAWTVAATTSVHASGLRVTCDGEDIGAEVQINGKLKGECPVDITIPEGTHMLRVFKSVDAAHERAFEQTIHMGDGVMTMVEAVLTPQLTAAGRAEVAKRDARISAEIAETMVAIPAGGLRMGSHVGDSDEKPIHSVTLRNFALSKTEITQGQWQAVMGSNPSYFSNCGSDCPVENVSWDDIQTFLQKLNAKTGKQYRLPSEAEWEYACRAGGAHQYCGNDSIDSVAWYKSNSGYKPHAVGQKQANSFGLYDMSGNVWEWVEDSYHNSYAGASADGNAWAGDTAKRVLRGGSWGYGPWSARAANRLRFGTTDRSNGIGFRLASMLP